MQTHDDRSAWREAVQAHTRATEAYIQAIKATTRALAGSRIDDRTEDGLDWHPMEKRCAWCQTSMGVVVVQQAGRSTSHGICDTCLSLEMAKLAHPVTTEREEAADDWEWAEMPGDRQHRVNQGRA